MENLKREMETKKEPKGNSKCEKYKTEMKKKKITRWLNSTFEISKEKIGELADGSIDIVFEEQKEKR